MNIKCKLQRYIDRAFCLLYENDQHLIYNGAYEGEERPDLKHHVGQRSTWNVWIVVINIMQMAVIYMKKNVLSVKGANHKTID